MAYASAIAISRIVLFAVLMAGGTWFDATQRRLPNSLVLITFAAGAVTAIVQFGLVAFGSNALHSLAALVIMAAIYALGWVGAGDAKFYAAIAAWFPISQALDMLMMVSALGLVLVLAWLMLLRLLRKERSHRERTARFPLGVPIAIGALAQFARYTFMPVT